MKYRLLRAIVGIVPEDGGMKIVTVNSGEVVQVIREVQRSGLVDVIVQGKALTMFMADIVDRGEQIEEASA